MKAFRGCRPTSLIALALVAMLLIFISTSARAQNAAQSSKASDSQSGNAENGKRLFVKYGCYECHGREGQGSSMTGPRLAPNPIPLEAIITYVRKPTREMPPYTEKVVSDQDLADIYAFLKSRPRPPAAK
jgi:mono/diheme cytochrome c family protein